MVAASPTLRAKITGSVTVPSARSVPMPFPISPGLPTRSMMSSDIWKAMPSA